jgi:hypothetical protein
VGCSANQTWNSTNKTCQCPSSTPYALNNGSCITCPGNSTFNSSLQQCSCSNASYQMDNKGQCIYCPRLTSLTTTPVPVSSVLLALSTTLSMELVHAQPQHLT